MRVTLLATRIAGNDGVSLEASHWQKILASMGHKVTLVAGQLDRAGILIPNLHFQYANTVKLYEKVVYGKNHFSKVENQIFTQSGEIEGLLRDLFRTNKSDLLVVPNVFSLPMHFPLAVALSRLIEEKRIPTIARHHDFWWERNRFNDSTLFPFFMRFFPPLLPTIQHVVINSFAQQEFKRRTGKFATVIADTSDFEHAVHRLDSYAYHWREDFGIASDDIVFLQATRIVPRKRIELSIELIDKLQDPKAVLVIAGTSGDEGNEYEKYLRSLVKKRGARVKFIGKYINSHRRVLDQRSIGHVRRKKRIYTLWDCYRNADFITYPTQLEGFGNQFLEAAFYKKPIILTPYPVYEKDIKPLGFETIEMPGKVTPKVLNQVHNFITDPLKIQQMVEHNFELGNKYYSYQATGEKILKIINSFDA